MKKFVSWSCHRPTEDVLDLIHDELNQAHLRPRHHRQTFVAIFEQHPFLLFYRV